MWRNVIFLFVLGFSSSLTTSFDLGGVVGGNRMGAVPLGRSLGHGELDVDGVCAAPGFACQDCRKAITCIRLPVGWLKVPLQECKNGSSCNAHEGGCSNNTVPECDVTARQYRHICEQVGIFPDAYDCRKFHLCSPPEGLPDGTPADHRTALCPRHYGYNPQTAQCSVLLTNGQCEKSPVPECTKVGETNVLSMSSNHYSVCLLKNGDLYPQIFICPHGWHFWGGFCQPNPQPTETTIENNTEKDKDSTISDVADKAEVTTTKIYSFFSTERATTYAADSFLADRFDLAHYESIDEAAVPMDEFMNSFETGNEEFW